MCVKVSITSFSFSSVAHGRPWSTFISYPLLMWWATRWVIKWVDSGSTSRDSCRTCWGYNTTMAAMSESHQWQKALQIFETCRSLAAGGSFWVIADKVLNSFRLLSVWTSGIGVFMQISILTKRPCNRRAWPLDFQQSWTITSIFRLSSMQISSNKYGHALTNVYCNHIWECFDSF